MRDFKFRAWDKKFKMMNEVLVMDFDSQKVNLHPDYNHQSYFRDIELMQYTGLKDKNGKEIYEGDIIGIFENVFDDEDNDNWILRTKHAIKYQSEYEYPAFDLEPAYDVNAEMNGVSALFHGDEFDDKFSKWEIIGNIYENPELISK